MIKVINMVLVVLFSFSFYSASANETETLAHLEKQNPQLMSLRAAGECTSTCSKNYYYPYDTVCKTVCPDGSSSDSGGYSRSCGGYAAVQGCLIGGLIGSLGTPIGTAMTAGCVGLGVVFYAISPACD